ncbi:MAG TPA: hypothetical protein PKV48_07280 [Thermodesulfobacteriota bacterium]|nr:hypothetical protein [Thermodesulfobacteriota bacterium]
MVKGSAVDTLNCRLGVKLKHIACPTLQPRVLSPVGSNEHIVFLVGVEIVEGKVRRGSDGAFEPHPELILVAGIPVVYCAGLAGYVLSYPIRCTGVKRPPI